MDRLPNRIIGIGLNLFLIAPTSEHGSIITITATVHYIQPKNKNCPRTLKMVPIDASQHEDSRYCPKNKIGQKFDPFLGQKRQKF